MRTLPGYPVHGPCHEVWRWYSVPSQDEQNQAKDWLLLKPHGWSHTTRGALLLPVTEHGLRAEALITPRVLKQWLVARGKEQEL